MKRFLCGLLLIFTAAHPVTAQKTRSARRQIESSYRRESDALRKENAAGVMVHYARDYQYVGTRGERYRTPQAHSILSQMFAAMRGIRSSVSLLSLSGSGKSLRARVRERLEGTFTEKRTKRSRKLVVVEDREDFWRQAGRSWVKWKSRSIKKKETMDGRPVRR